MKKFLYLPFIVLTAIVALTACEMSDKSKYEAWPPMWKGFSMEPTSVSPGQEVTITAMQDKKGRYIGTTKYTWTLTVTVFEPTEDNVNATKTVTLSPIKQVPTDGKTNYDGTYSGDPSATFDLPLQTVPGCKATVNFTGEYIYYSAYGVQIFDNNNYNDPGLGTLHSTSSTVAGKATGTYSFKVASEE